jgi:HPt (histidine-containing phosphotransfer) domain-containing protein
VKNGASDAAAAPDFDRAALLERLDADEEMVQEVVDAFLADSPRMLAALRTALRAHAFDAVALAAHTLKGALLAIAAGPAAAIATRLEHVAVGGDRPAIEAESEALESAIDGLCTVLVGVTEVA